MVKMESVPEITIFGQKSMVKSGQENCILKSLDAGNYFAKLPHNRKDLCPQIQIQYSKI